MEWNLNGTYFFISFNVGTPHKQIINGTMLDFTSPFFYFGFLEQLLKLKGGIKSRQSYELVYKIRGHP